jgi:Tol biopolymer transport system component
VSSLDWVPELATALDGLVPLEESSRADWDDVVGRLDRRQLRLGHGRPRRRVRLAIVVALLLLLLTGVATATYLIARGGNGKIAIGADGLRLVDPNGPGLRTIAGCAVGSSGCTVSQPAWSPGGTRVAFVRGFPGGPNTNGRMSVYVAASKGGGAHRLASCGGCGGQWGALLGWSPDGTRVAFSRDAGPMGQEALWVVAAAGGRPHRLTDCRPAWCADVDPVWSPDGHLIVFERITHEGRWGHRLYTIRPDGSGLTKIADGAEPEWSPDGTRIAFDGAGGITVANADGSDTHLLVAGSGGTGPGVPSWSPDGKKLVFFQTPGAPGAFVAEVWTINADGSDKKRLYRSGCCVMVWAAPIWSPDGRMIAFSATSAGGTFVINADGTGLRRISPDTPYSLSWQKLPRH